jgi:2-methylcitrate dehydratase PrpD
MESERVMGLAGSQAGGTFASFGTPTIKFHQARAAMSATLAIALSQSGFVGPESILTHPDGGIFPTYSGGGSPRLATEGLGQTWELMNTTVRLWPAAAALQAVLTIVADGDMPRTGDIDHIQVSLPSDNYRMHAAMGWDTRFEATLSARFVTSFVLHGHSMWDLSDESITDSDVIGFADQRVSVAEDADLPQGGVGLRIKSAGAEAELRLLHPRGSPENPATWPDIVEKMHITGDAILGRDQVGAVLETIENIEALADVRTLTRLLSAIRRGSTG